MRCLVPRSWCLERTWYWRLKSSICPPEQIENTEPRGTRYLPGTRHQVPSRHQAPGAIRVLLRRGSETSAAAPSTPRCPGRVVAVASCRIRHRANTGKKGFPLLDEIWPSTVNLEPRECFPKRAAVDEG